MGDYIKTVWVDNSTPSISAVNLNKLEDGVDTAHSEFHAHEAAADPHAGYQRESEKGAVNGYAGLDGSTLIPTVQLGTGTADNTKFLRGDRTWATPTGGGGGSLTVQDENGNVATNVTQLDFQGAGIAASAGTGEVIVTVSGAGGGGTASIPVYTQATLPAASAGNATQLAFVSDLNGGTLVRSNGVSWPQIAKGLTETERVNILVNGTLIANRGGVNLIAGTNQTISGADNAVNDRVDVTVTGTGGGGGGGGGMLVAPVVHTPASTLSVGTTLADFDATNLAITFTAPANGKVRIVVNANVFLDASSTTLSLALREGTTTVGPVQAWSGSTNKLRVTGIWIISGITAGSHTYKVAGQTATGTGRIGSDPVIIEAWPVP